MWRPKGEVIKEQCRTCPFGPNAHELNDSEGAIAHAREAAHLGLDFHCHQSVYVGALKVPNPKMRPQSEWKVCAGMVKYKQDREVERMKQALRERGRLIEDE